MDQARHIKFKWALKKVVVFDEDQMNELNRYDRRSGARKTSVTQTLDKCHGRRLIQQTPNEN